MDLMQRTLNRNLVKYAAGRAIFCPSCDDILDQKRTVVVTTPAGRTMTYCGQCWDKVAAVAAADPRFVELDILDGRQLFKRGAK